MKKISYKLTLIMIVIVGLSVLTLGIFIAHLLEEIYVDALANRLEEEAKMLSTIFKEEEFDFNNEQLEIISKEMGESLSTRITLIAPNGKVIADSDYDRNKMENHKERPEVQEALSGASGKAIRYSNTLGLDMLYVTTPIYHNEQIKGVVRLALPIHAIQMSIKNFWYILILGLVFIFLLTIIVSFRISNKITKPIEHITKIARNITMQNYSERLKIDRKDEIGQLGTAINIMAESLENQMTTIYENEKKLMTVLNNMSSGVILVDLNGRIILANPAIESLLGESIENIIGKHHNDVGKQDSISALIEKVFSNGTSIQTEVEINYPSHKFLNSNLVPILDVRGEINGVLAVLHDITKIKKLETMRTEFVANVSHELRTPITSVKGFAETLLEGTIQDEETKKQFIQIIYNESDRLHRLIVDLLDLSKIELNKEILNLSKFDVKNLIESTVEAMKPQIEKRKLEVILELNQIEIIADEDRLKQVIINLFTNAIVYTPENGTIKCKLDKHANGKIKIEVEDTGIGIPPKNLSRIFERFYRVDKARSRESGGTGLGLAIAKHIIESHNGNIQVYSEVDKGTKFVIILPKKQSA